MYNDAPEKGMGYILEVCSQPEYTGATEENKSLGSPNVSKPQESKVSIFLAGKFSWHKQFSSYFMHEVLGKLKDLCVLKFANL
jgi:hypothetical protein